MPKATISVLSVSRDGQKTVESKRWTGTGSASDCPGLVRVQVHTPVFVSFERQTRAHVGFTWVAVVIKGLFR